MESSSKQKSDGSEIQKTRPVDNFIVDFMAQEINLIIEVDGNSHDLKSQYDRYRQDKLEELGFHFLRFTEGEVMNGLSEVYDKIEHAIYVLKGKA